MLSVLIATDVVSAVADSSSNVEVDFSRQIRPLLAKQCFSCHGPDKQESGVALHEFGKATSEADSGLKPIVPGDISASEILRRIASDDPDLRMPPEGHRSFETASCTPYGLGEIRSGIP